MLGFNAIKCTFVSAEAEATGCADASAKEELQLEIRRLRERIKGLESENTTMHIKMSKTQQDVDQRLTDIEMQIGPEEPPLLVGLEPVNADNNDCPIFVGSATTTTTAKGKAAKTDAVGPQRKAPLGAVPGGAFACYRGRWPRFTSGRACVPRWKPRNRPALRH